MAQLQQDIAATASASKELQERVQARVEREISTIPARIEEAVVQIRSAAQAASASEIVRSSSSETNPVLEERCARLEQRNAALEMNMESLLSKVDAVSKGPSEFETLRAELAT